MGGGPGSSRRRLVAALSVLANIALILAAWHEGTRINACDRNNNDAAAQPQQRQETTQLSVGSVAGAARRLLSAASVSASPASRALLATEVTGADSLGTLWPAPAPGAGLDISGDLSALSSPKFDLGSHEVAWSYCPLVSKAYHPDAEAKGGAGLRPFCPEQSNAEQAWQKEWFGAHVVPGAPRRPLPLMLPCTHLPPSNYRWPERHPPLPAPATPAVPYANLRLGSLEDLVKFNPATPKNLYHFDAAKYDLDALGELRLAEQVIPFANKVRLMLDVGAGGGSLGLLAKRKYDVQTLSTVFADWPYCEYITERGQPCILVDVMEAMPFAKFSFDVVHMSWVYHGQTVDELRVMMHEINRVIRPGGYLWLRGGWSYEQLDFLNEFLPMLGYGALHYSQTAKPKEVSAKVFFGPQQTLAYQVDSTSIWLKPIAKQMTAEGASCAPQTTPQPLTATTTTTTPPAEAAKSAAA